MGPNPPPMIVGDLLNAPHILTDGGRRNDELPISRARAEARDAYLRELALDAEAYLPGGSAARFDWSD